jgi:hypothetical protein
MIRPALFRKCSLLLVFLLMAGGTLAGCGKKGPVRPLPQPVPMAPEEFVLRQQGRQMLLVWTMPAFNEDGSPLTDLAGFRIYRGLYPPGDNCPTCLQTPNLWRVVDLEYLRDVQRVGDRFLLVDSGLEIGQGYQYRIIPYNRWGQDGKVVLARQVIVEPPPAPAGTGATSETGRLVVTWQPVAELPEGMELLGYNIYRRRPGASFTPAPRNNIPLPTSPFLEQDFEEGKTYFYAVRTVIRQDGRIIESALSEPAAVAGF